MKYFIFLLIILSLNIAYATKVLVIVDGVAITDIDVKNRIDALKILYPGFTDDVIARKQILNNLISEELFHNEANRLKFKVSEEEVRNRFKEMQVENNYTEAQINSFMKNKNLYKQVESQVLWSDLVSAVFYNKIKVSEAEIREEQKVNSQEIVEVDFKQILFNSYESEKIIKMKKEKVNCENIDVISKKLGFGKPYHNVLLYKDLNPELQSVLKILPLNRLSDILQFNELNQVIILCNKKTTTKTIDPKVIKQKLTSRKINAEAQKYLSELKKRIYVEYINPIE